MFKESNQSASAFKGQSALLPDYAYEFGRHLLLGSLSFVQTTINQLHQLN